MKVHRIYQINVLAKCFIALGIFVLILIEYVRPWVAEFVYEEEYKRLTYECDNAMHDEVSIRSNPINSELNDRLQKSAEVGLLVCHDYDKLRKKLLILGISEDQLALYGLETLENQLIPTSRMVEPHKMDRF
jgi:hypothetical protein